MSNQQSESHPEESHAKHGDSKSDRVDNRSKEKLGHDATEKSDREAFHQRERNEQTSDKGQRAKSPEEVAALAKRGEIKATLGDASKALGFSLGLTDDGKTILPGRSAEEVSMLKGIEPVPKAGTEAQMQSKISGLPAGQALPDGAHVPSSVPGRQDREHSEPTGAVVKAAEAAKIIGHGVMDAAGKIFEGGVHAAADGMQKEVNKISKETVKDLKQLSASERDAQAVGDASKLAGGAVGAVFGVGAGFARFLGKTAEGLSDFEGKVVTAGAKNIDSALKDPTNLGKLEKVADPGSAITDVLRNDMNDLGKQMPQIADAAGKALGQGAHALGEAAHAVGEAVLDPNRAIDDAKKVIHRTIHDENMVKNAIGGGAVVGEHVLPAVAGAVDIAAAAPAVVRGVRSGARALADGAKTLGEGAKTLAGAGEAASGTDAMAKAMGRTERTATSSATDAHGVITTNNIDGSRTIGNLVKSIDNTGTTHTWKDGQIVESIDRQGTRTAYNADGSVSSQEWKGGAKTTYDKDGTIKHVDKDGRTTITDNNGIERVVQPLRKPAAPSASDGANVNTSGRTEQTGGAKEPWWRPAEATKSPAPDLQKPAEIVPGWVQYSTAKVAEVSGKPARITLPNGQQVDGIETLLPGGATQQKYSQVIDGKLQACTRTLNHRDGTTVTEWEGHRKVTYKDGSFDRYDLDKNETESVRIDQTTKAKTRVVDKPKADHRDTYYPDGHRTTERYSEPNSIEQNYMKDHLARIEQARQDAEAKGLPFHYDKPSEGWKIHLNVPADKNAPLTKTITDYLDRERISYKVGKAGDQTGKGMTIYVGPRDELEKVAAKLDKELGKVLPEAEGDAARMNEHLTRSITARFDVHDKPDGISYDKESGINGIPVARAQSGGVNSNIKLLDLSPDEIEQIRASARAAFEDRYGAFFTGTKQAEPAVLKPHSAEGPEWINQGKPEEPPPVQRMPHDRPAQGAVERPAVPPEKRPAVKEPDEEPSYDRGYGP